jgi:hypothetical protein
MPSAQSSGQRAADFGRAKDVISPTVADKADVNGIPLLNIRLIRLMPLRIEGDGFKGAANGLIPPVLQQSI